MTKLKTCVGGSLWYGLLSMVKYNLFSGILICICSYLQVICCGVLIASAIAIADITDLFKDDGENLTGADDRDKYRDVAVWLLSVGFVGLITQAIIAIIRGLYYGEIITSWFAIFGITVSINVYIIVYIVTDESYLLAMV